MNDSPAEEGKNPNVIEPKKTEIPRNENGRFQSPKNFGFSDEELDFIPLKQYFEIDAVNRDDDKYLRSILEWAREKGFASKDDMHAELRSLELKLGSPELGEKRTTRVARYLELDRQLSSTLKAMRQFDKR